MAMIGMMYLRGGIQKLSLVLLLSISVWFALNYRTSGLDLSFTSTSSGLSMAASGISSLGTGDLHRQSVGGGEMRRQLLQVASPAPGPSQQETQGYISYGSLTAGYVPCPPQSGRSYYTPKCTSATGAANPYTRGCTVITDCARD